MTLRAATHVLVGCALSLPVAACGTAASSPPAATTPTTPVGSAPASAAAAGACSLVDSADAARVFGEAFSPGTASTPGGNSNCLFVQAGGNGDTVSLTVFTGPGAANAFQVNQTTYASSPVSGVGDSAFVSTDGGAFGTLRGTTCLVAHNVGFAGQSAGTLQAEMKTWVSLALGRS